MLLIGRHGATSANEAGHLLGTQDCCLSELGERQAQRLATWLKRRHVTRILSSDSLRARETASIISVSLGVSFTTHAELRERDFACYDGMSRAELVRARLSAGHIFADPTQDWFGVKEVESDQEVFARVTPLLYSVYQRQSQDDIFCVTHAGVIKSFLHQTLEISEGRSNCFRVPNGAVLVFDYDKAGHFQLCALHPELEYAP